MKRIIILLIIVLAMLVCCSCGLVGDQRYVCDVEKVDSVQIIRLDDYIEGEYRYDYTVLSEISDYETFVSQLNEVDHSVNWGDPRQLDEQYVVIRINYSNGEWDMLHADAQWFHRSGVIQYGYFFFDDEQFDSLISDYLGT